MTIPSLPQRKFVRRAAVAAVLTRIEHNSVPETLHASIAAVGISDPYQAQSVLLATRQRLRPPDGSHARLTARRAWLRGREGWAIRAGVPSGTDLVTAAEPKVPALENAASALRAMPGLPDGYLDTTRTMMDMLSTRAGRALDPSTLKLYAEMQRIQALSVVAASERQRADAQAERADAQAKLNGLLVERIKLLEAGAAERGAGINGAGAKPPTIVPRFGDAGDARDLNH